MWLDRFSGQSTPTGNHTPNRYPSPAPRRTSHLAPGQRSGLGLGSNRSNVSLDLSGNTSTASLVSFTKAVNGSALRYEQRPPADVDDPVDVLQSLLAQGGDVNGHDANSVIVEENKAHVDFAGLSLQQLVEKKAAAQIRSHSTTQRPSVDNRQKLEDFHASISASDQVLESVESYLTNFQSELGQVSAEIEDLQERSVQLNAKLENRRQVEKLLGPAVEDVSISPVTVRAIADGPIDDVFMKALTEVDARSAILDGKKGSGPVKALEDVKPLLNDLKAKAVERIRDYVVAQIKAIRAPGVNAQVIQMRSFTRHRDMFTFLAHNHPILSEEIAQAYINTMKWYYVSNFTRYQQALQKLPLHLVDQTELMGSDPAAAKRSMLGASKTPSQQHDLFSLGRRSEVLRFTDETVIPSYLAEDSKTAHYLEIPFRNFNQALIDNVTAEYSIATEMFSTASYQQVSRKAVEMFEPTFTLGHDLTKHLVENTADCIGILICVRLNQHFAFVLQRRKVPIADSYINYTNILLWPRFQQVMDLHCESLKKVPVAGNRGAAAAFSLVGGGGDASKASVAPHAVTQRFGQFLHAILSLSKDAGDDEPVSRSLGRLRSEYQALMTKLSKAAGDTSKRSRFLFNNYSLVQTIIGDAQGKLAEDQKDFFASLLADTKVK
ncbi:Vacuolar protein sorting-associated protein 52 B [Cyphellophora attinorum]|uniref:Vacuolar protein sorting-associated protein 52 B n=1 Tax=Cyphellophora attinorum TaxID=1664694 RepID=A0A0N1H8Y3_9EURO|nr:Vacuolar protein sorting-associated protein 52 B [Phialophora attinorum]KPI43750.1 Vacuolar protein sorting-associated protein 52 B [Phialophora attinorum]